MPARKTWFTGILVEPDWDKENTDLKKQSRFVQQTLRDLAKIAQCDLGMDLLKLLAKRHEGVGTSGRGDERTVIIRMHRENAQGADTRAWYAEQKYHRERKIGDRTIKFAGKGSKTVIYYHNEPADIYTKLVGIPTPTWLALAHELIHAYHHLSGTTYKEAEGTDRGVEVKYEELYTTGLGPYANTRLSENAIRKEVGLQLRTHYYFPGDTGYVKALAVGAPMPLGQWMCCNIQKAIDE